MSQMEYLLEYINFTLVYFSIRILQENIKALYLKTGFFLKFSQWNNWKVGCHINYREIKVSLKHSPFFISRKNNEQLIDKEYFRQQSPIFLRISLLWNVKLLKS